MKNRERTLPGDGQTLTVIPITAAVAEIFGGPSEFEIQSPNATKTEQAGHGVSDIPNKGASLLHHIRAAYWRRTALHRAELRIAAQLKAIGRALERNGQADLSPALYPELHAVLETLHAARLKSEKPLRELQKELPIYQWSKGIRGFGSGANSISLVTLIAEIGDPPGSYRKKVAGIWKRMSMHVEGGKAAKPTRGVANGVNPRRRAIMSVIGDNLIRAGDPLYKAVYAKRKADELARDPEMRPIIAHRRAKRYMEKRLLKHLWQAWREATRDAIPEAAAPLAESSGASRAADQRRADAQADTVRSNLRPKGRGRKANRATSSYDGPPSARKSTRKP